MAHMCKIDGGHLQMFPSMHVTPVDSYTIWYNPFAKLKSDCVYFISMMPSSESTITVGQQFP